MIGGHDDEEAPAASQPSPSQPNVVATEIAADGSVSVSSVGDDGNDRFDGRIHVFSLASGRVYERLLSIMMLSVSRRASLPVTFWLVENFLSPEFKENLPTLCKTFGYNLNCVRLLRLSFKRVSLTRVYVYDVVIRYRVELITYKWPHWLRQQTEKQRIIWGYKILFLDVLFPLDLKKVIYVDADQVRQF